MKAPEGPTGNNLGASGPFQRGDIISGRGNNGGISDALQEAFLMHRHDGSAVGGQQLYGPYLIRDSSDGHTYKLVSTAGVLSLELVV